MSTSYGQWKWACVFAIGLLPTLDSAHAQSEAQPQPEVRTFSFEMRNQPWSKVFEWLADQNKSQFIASATPNGTFNFVPGSQKKYTMAQIIDILNEALIAKGHLLIHRANSLLLMPADEPVPVELVPRVRLNDLAGRGNTELVSVVVALKTEKADDIAPEIKKLLSPFGQVVVLKQPNQLVIQDLTGNLRKVIETISGVENADMLPQAKKPRKNGDAPQTGQLQPQGPPMLRTYPVPGGNASALAKLLQEIHKNSPNFRITALGPNSILVYASPDDQIELARHLTDGARINTELIPLSVLDPSRVAETLRQMFGDARAGGPYVEAETDRNALIVRGTPAQLMDIKEVLIALGEGGGQKGGMRILNLQQGSAVTLAEAMQKLLADMRPNLSVKVVLPGVAAAAGKTKTEPDKQAGKAGKGDGTLTITAMANRLIVTSDSAESLALITELFRMLTTTRLDSDFEVIRLKNGDARNVARVLDEAFNGGKGGGLNMPRGERVRVIADASTNSLLVKGSALDTLTIRRLLDTALDVESAASGPVDGPPRKKAPGKKGAD